MTTKKQNIQASRQEANAALAKDNAAKFLQQNINAVTDMYLLNLAELTRYKEQHYQQQLLLTQQNEARLNEAKLNEVVQQQNEQAIKINLLESLLADQKKLTLTKEKDYQQQLLLAQKNEDKLTKAMQVQLAKQAKKITSLETALAKQKELTQKAREKTTEVNAKLARLVAINKKNKESPLYGLFSTLGR